MTKTTNLEFGEVEPPSQAYNEGIIVRLVAEHCYAYSREDLSINHSVTYAVTPPRRPTASDRSLRAEYNAVSGILYGAPGYSLTKCLPGP